MKEAVPHKVYDYNSVKVKEQIIQTLKKCGRESTVADIVSNLGLPIYQVEEQLKSVADEYSSRLRVTESGEILYSFPRGFTSKYTGFLPTIKRFGNKLLSSIIKIGTLVFKAWIAVMLIGYFVLFLALAVITVIASIAISMSGSKDSNNNNRKNDSFLGFALTTRLIELFIRLWFYSEVFKTSDQRYREQRNRSQKRPLHKAVFSFVFGDGDPNASWSQITRKVVLEYLYAHKGVISLTEFQAIVGLSKEEAEQEIMHYVYEFNGSPEVTDDGTMYFSFPEVMRRYDSIKTNLSFSIPDKQKIPFSINAKKMNNWFCFFNGFNLLIGFYFASYSAGIIKIIPEEVGFDLMYQMVLYGLGQLNIQGENIIFIILGIIPIVFSILFYLIPLLRSFTVNKKNNEINDENTRRQLYKSIWANPMVFNTQIVSTLHSKNAQQIIDSIASELSPDVNAGEKQSYNYTFTEIDRQKKDMVKIRSQMDTSTFKNGKIIFDSDSNEIQ